MKPLVLITVLAGALAAQDYYPHHNVTFGVGAAQPRADLRPNFETSPGITLGYGYRFQRYFQADLGLDVVFGAAGVRDYLNTGFGPLRIRDYQFFLPFGGRAILPLAKGRFLFSGGGGGVWGHYTELLHQPSDFYRIDCPVCGSRSGWGYYTLLGTTVFLDRNMHWRVGATGKVYRLHTEGDPLGTVPGLRTRDHWVNVYGEFGVSF